MKNQVIIRDEMCNLLFGYVNKDKQFVKNPLQVICHHKLLYKKNNYISTQELLNKHGDVYLLFL